MATRMQQRRGTAEQWTAANPVLAAGEFGFETDSSKFKVGDGVNAWGDLDYFINEAAITLDIGGAISDSEKGAANGVASLDSTGNVPMSQLGNIIAGAPAALDTLNEISAALDDDSSFATTIVSALGNKVATAVFTSHENSTTNVHGIADTSVLVTNSDLATELADYLAVADVATAVGELITDYDTTLQGQLDTIESNITTTTASNLNTGISDHNASTISVHGIADTALLATKAYAETQVSDHSADTTSVHGIADTSALATKTYADDAVSTHNSDTTSVHGIADTSVLATQTDVAGAVTDAEAYADSAIGTHNSDTTSVHGIADTSKIVLKDALSTTLDGDLTVSGNLVIEGTTTTVNATDLVVTDPLIYIGEGNSANLVDLGLVSSFNDGTYQHSGIVRDASAGTWKIFKGVTDEPTTTVNFAQGSLDNLAVNNLTAAGVVFTDGTQTKEGVASRTPIIQKTSAYTLSSLSERDSLVEVSSASGVTITIPTNASVAYPVGTSIDILQTSTGQVTIAGADGVTVNATPGLKLRTQWSSATLFKRANDTWVVMGDLSA